ncbi:MAG: DUF1294 domain-containing protein [Lachnospiraceae bacterium]|jgi:uncharacterized membrane protein YsdA (DUF1294 family)|nr:DUF1294 domain-containing protein [Lachnospiraceae bacterium]MDO4876873.1 DUF1294 domain-containing protein [Oscillospiraceae bacterium]
MKIFLVFYALMTIVTFILYGVDKGKAKKGRWRIPEKTLLLFAACFGGLGAFLGMKIFRHKTKHTSFKILVPTFMIIQFILIAAGVYFLYIRH